MQENGDENEWDHSLSYENKFDTKDRKLNANVSYSYGSEHETEKNLSKEVNINNITIKDRHDYKNTIVSFDYEDKFDEKFNISIHL